MPLRASSEDGMAMNTTWLGLAALSLSGAAAWAQQPRAMIVVDETAVRREEPTPHGGIGTSTAYRISDRVPGRTMEFRKRVLHPGAAIGLHPLAHDEIYYVLSGTGEVQSGADRRRLTAGMAAYLYDGATVGIRQLGRAPLVLIVSYPVTGK
jgi:mannose-6-phosphate isomerase-like protein (cupin superfamily)